jgi:Cdc6-like AAA superfamily ATPase
MVPFRFAVEQTIKHPLRFRHNAIYEFFQAASGRGAEHVHVFMDDAHQVAQFEKSGSVKWTEVIHQLYEAARTFKKKLQMVIVGTTPYLDYGTFVSRLHKDDKVRADLKPLVFDAYKPAELKRIYDARLQLAEVDFESEASDWVIETVIQNAGELPMGFQMLLAGVELMIQQHSRVLQQAHVESAFKSVKVDYWSQKVAEMDKQTRMIFLATTLLAVEHMQKNGAFKDVELSGHQIAEEYDRLCHVNHLEPLYAQRRNYILQKLCMRGGMLSRAGVDTKTFSNKYRYELNPRTMHDTMTKMGLIKD